MKVKFKGVGASNQNWTADIEKLDHDLFYSEVKSSGAIMSSDIDFSVDDNGINGQIIVGGFRVVGEFEVLGGRV